MKIIFTILFVSFSLTTLAQAPVNDEAPGAIELIVGAPCNTAYTTENATKSANERDVECRPPAIPALVWFKFVATASAVKMTTDLPNPGTIQGEIGHMALYSATNVNDYATFNILACDYESGSVYKETSSTLYATDLNVGQTYYIVVSHYIGIGAPPFCITVENLNSSLLSTTNTCDSGYQRTLTYGSYLGQLSLVDNKGKLLAIIQKTPSGTLNGNTFAAQNIYTGPSLRQDGAGNYYIDRNFRFSNVLAPTNVIVKLFFLDSEIAELTAIDPTITLNTLGITRQTGDICTNDFGAGNGLNSPLTITGTGSQKWCKLD